MILVWGKYGVVPTEINKGELNANSRYDYSAMVLEMESYLKYIEGNEFWYEELVPSSLRLNMDKYMGRPPEEFMYEFKEIIPHEFLNTVVKLNLDDYIGVMSTFSKAYYENVKYEVETIWRHSNDYYNLPLDQFYEIIKYTIQNGYTVRSNGDVSEPGHNDFEDAAIIPAFDIPRKYIDQNTREFCFNNNTSDNHDTH